MDAQFYCERHDEPVHTHADITIHKVHSPGPCEIRTQTEYP